MALRVRLISSGNSLEIPANPYPMYPHVECLNSVAQDSATGHRHVFVHGPHRVNASIEFKNLSRAFVKRYEDFILNVLKLGQVPFTLECPPYIDFGLGMGVSIPVAYYSGPPTLKDIITTRDDAGLFYDIELPYMFVRPNEGVSDGRLFAQDNRSLIAQTGEYLYAQG
ncbi:MAG: hypothetical protein LBC64_01920 [Fibromonadaceae bacterium]|jgi:hypothetical protein|nr:hypothetical protein [Fibromonadaceae bacterium]